VDFLWTACGRVWMEKSQKISLWKSCGEPFKIRGQRSMIRG